MLDPYGDFNSPCYDDIFRRNYVFDEEFGDVENYFIELDYWIMREAFVSRRHNPLDLELRHYDNGGNAKKIFRDVSASESAVLSARNYIVLAENIDVSSSVFGDIYHVTETYGYVPNKVFVTHESRLVNSYAWVLNSGATFTSVVFDLDANCWKITDSSKLLNVGDQLYAKIVFQNGVAYCQPTSVVSVYGDYAYATATSGTYYGSNGSFADIDPGVYAWWVQWPSGYITRNGVQMYKGDYKLILGHKRREASQVVSSVNKRTTFSLTPPTSLQSAYQPMNPDGTPADIFSARSTPTVETHIANVKNRTMVLAEDESIEAELWHGLYRKTSILTPCK